MRVSGNGSGSVSRSGLSSLLQDLSQVITAHNMFPSMPLSTPSNSWVFRFLGRCRRKECSQTWRRQWGRVFIRWETNRLQVISGHCGDTLTCFCLQVSTPTASEEHVSSWLQSEPPLLLWLPTLYRLSVSRNVSHAVRCHTCKTRPFIGLRWACTIQSEYFLYSHLKHHNKVEIDLTLSGVHVCVQISLYEVCERSPVSKLLLVRQTDEETQNSPSSAWVLHSGNNTHTHTQR